MSRASRDATAGLLLRHLLAGRATSVLLAVLVGMAVLVIALIPRAAASLAEAELQDNLRQQSPLRVDLTASGRLGWQQTDGDPQTGEEVFAQLQEGLDQLPASLGAPLSGILGNPEWIAQFSDLQAAPREPRTNAVIKLALALAVGWEERVRFVDGVAPARWGGDVTDELADTFAREPIEIAVSANAAERMGLRVGDLIDVETAPLLVSGVYEPLKADAAYWMHAYPLARVSEFRDPGGLSLLSASVFVNTLTSVGLAENLPNAQIQVWYPAVVDTIHYADASELLIATQQLTALGKPMPNGEQLVFQSSLFDAIDAVVERMTAVTALLALTGSAPLGVVIAVLALGVRSVLERRRHALALAAARGATTIQLRVTMLLEGALVALPVSALAIVVAVVAIPARVGPEALALPVLVALAVPVLFTVTTSPRLLGTARADISSRARRRSRWVVEVIVLGLAALALVLLARRGLVTSSASLGLDPLLAATPLLLALATCVIVLRVYPVPLLALQRLSRRRRGAVGMLGAARAVRDPSGGFVGTLAIVVAVSAAVFSLLLGATVSAGLESSARAAVGSDIRIEAADLPPALVDDVVASPGVRAAIAYDTSAEIPIDLGFNDVTVTAVFADLATLDELRPDLGVAAIDDGVDVPFYASDAVARRMQGGTTTISDRAATLRGVLGEGALPKVAGLWILLDERYAPEFLDDELEPDVLLLATDPGVDVAAVGASLADLIRVEQLEGQRDRVELADVTSLLELAASRPSTAGLTTALVVAAGLSLLLGLLAIVLGTVAATGARNRLVGVVRMLGMTPRQVRGVVAWELAPVAIAAVIAGTALGIALSYIVVGVLDLRPFVGGTEQVLVTIPVTLVVVVTLGFAAAIIVAGFAAIGAARRISPAATVKMGAE